MKTLRPYGTAWKALEHDAAFKQALQYYCASGDVDAVGIISDSTVPPTVSPFRHRMKEGSYIIVGMEWLLLHKRWHPFIAKAILMS